MESDQIRALLKEGLTNRVIADRTGCALKKIAQARRDGGYPPAPRSAWKLRPHPKLAEIRALLGEGHTDTAIRKANGADVSTVARIRREGGFGAPSIIRRATRRHPKEAAIRQLLAQNRTTEAIARELGVDRAAVRRIRREAGVPNTPTQPLTLNEAWAIHTKPVDGGHLEWTGSRVSVSRTPTLRYKDVLYTAGAVAFRQHTGRDPVGQVKSECGMAQCVEPSHVEDEPGRARIREQLHHVLGKEARKPFCRREHDQAVHGRYGPNGGSYCQACHNLQRRNTESTQPGRKPDVAGVEPVEFLYELWDANWDDGPVGNWKIRAHPITKKTPKRIYFTYSTAAQRAGYVDRQKIEADGEIYHGYTLRRLHLQKPELPTPPKPATLAELKAEMAAAHPDRGGTEDAFIAARKRYESARAAQPQ